ncbi:Asp-protease-2 domain containing protein [Pyrenophora tritici-repentis]|uniref:Asp-protease-2 domain containing protein n=1 Tax=Pyrenophora tritici-repentis TaxID=45151 RepID=A0A834S558_9PLEO|nr:Asp-protease-2 domain containing protein [Pyrenophora tritici-repentis]
MLQLKLNKANLEIEPWSLQWTPREAELMANQVIRGEVNRQADERATALRSYMPQAYLAPPAQNPRYNNAMNYQQTQGQQSQQGYQQSNQRPIGYQNYSNNSQTFQPKTGYGNQNNQYSQVAGAGFLCWVCDKTGHQKNDCPTLRGFVDKGWCYLDERSQLNWGTPSNPQGRITNLGTRRWAEAISAEIKRRWIKQDIDPLSYESPFLKDPQSSLPVENNAISVQLVPDSSGTITADDYEQFWNLSSVLGETDSDTSSQLRGANQCNNNTVASATIARADTRKKPSASHNPSKVQKAAPKAVLKRPPEEHIPHLRGHKNRDDNYFLDRNLSKDRTVQFADTPGPADTDMLDAPVDSEPKKAPKDPQPETKDKHTRKHRIVEKLAPDAQKVIQQILDTEISLPLKTVLGNMPEVRKKLFQQGYTTEEFNKLQINATSHSLEQESCESDSDEGLRPISLVNSLSLGQLPDYVLITDNIEARAQWHVPENAVAGRVTQCYHIDAEHWTDAQISHVQQHIIAEEDQDVGPVADDSIDSQQEYDRAAGIEHLRRDCPKVPIEIRGNNFLTLLDSGAELNTMKRETAEKANLPITSLPKSMSSARMVSANGTTECFVGIVWGVPIRIGRIEVRTNFFVIESCTNPIILGNPFLTDARARIEYATNGLTYCRIFSEDGEFNTRFLAECGSTGYVSSVQARMGMTGTEREGEEMKPVTEWLKKKRLEKPRAPSEQKYFCWGPNTFLGKGPDGTIVVKDEEGLFVVANECAESLSDNILSEVVGALGGCEYEERGVDVVWKEQLSDIRKNKTGMPIEVVTMVKLKPSEAQKEKGHFEVNGMHKRKGQKVEPIDDSGQAPRKVEGRLDWKERAKAKQVPNADHARAPFAQYFEPRYADFPRGTRVTPERLKEMKISPDLWPRERQLLEELLFRREAALAWDFRESGRVSREVIPPVVIDTVPHKAWRVDQFPVPRKLREIVIEMIQDRINRGTLELCKSQYRNPWFLVAKKDKGYRLINNAQKINGVTIRDANPPPNPDEFSEEFAGCVIMSLMDFFSGYDQVELHKNSRDITAFATPLGLVRQCTLPMGTTNSIAEFVRVMTKICRDHIPHRCMPYLDDVCVKGPKTTYNEEEIEPGIRRYVAEHLSNIDQVLADIERAGATISGHKSDFCYASMIVVGYRIDKHGRHPDMKKVEKIRTWPNPKNQKEVRIFLGMCVYYRIWIIGFAIVAEPLFLLLRKNAPFVWLVEQQSAMNFLKEALCNTPALVSIDYSEPLRAIIVAADSATINRIGMIDSYLG